MSLEIVEYGRHCAHSGVGLLPCFSMLDSSSQKVGNERSQWALSSDEVFIFISLVGKGKGTEDFLSN